jgi:hypothetical protein
MGKLEIVLDSIAIECIDAIIDIARFLRGPKFHGLAWPLGSFQVQGQLPIVLSLLWS